MFAYHGSYGSSLDTRVANQNWLKKHKGILKQTNPTFNAIMIDEWMKKSKSKRITGIENRIHYSQLKQIPKEISLTKFQHYLLENNCSFRYYMDYIHMLNELDIKLNDDTIVFPKDLRIAHDNAVTTINQIKKELEEKTYLQRKAELLKLEKTIDEFVFLVPKELQEIVSEGNTLHHCVGSNYYIENHKKGETTIVFVRKKNDIKTPYFTIEYRNKKVVQKQGKYNRELVPKKLEKAINKWEKSVQKIS